MARKKSKKSRKKASKTTEVKVERIGKAAKPKKKAKRVKSLRLPVLRRSFKLVQESFVPEVFRAPTDIAVYEGNRRAYEILMGTGTPYCGLVDEYKELVRAVRLSICNGGSKPEEGKSETKKPKPAEKPTALAKKKSAALQRVLERSALDEYRKKHGLDKLREKLVEAIASAADFERGVDMVFGHTVSSKNKTRHEKNFEAAAYEMMEKKEKTVDGKKSTIVMYYPNLTADEIAWISLARDTKALKVFDQHEYLYWPPSLIDIDLDGLLFAHGTINDSERATLDSTNPYEIGGITGIDNKIELCRFHPNVAQIVKALVLLSLDDSDLYDKLWKEEDVTAVRRGDDLLLRSFWNPSEYGIKPEDEEKTLADLIKDGSNTFGDGAARSIRREVAELYFRSDFNCPHMNSLVDFVKMIGTLERAPNFVQEKKPFRGYVRIYGVEMNFIGENGRIIDSVPLAPHLQGRVAHQFHQRISQLDNKDRILSGIFKELADKISAKNIEEGNQMSIDMLQDEVLEAGVFVSQQSYATVQEMTGAEFLGKKYKDREKVVRTTKFSFEELQHIKNLLGMLPPQLRKGISTITKRNSPYVSIETILAMEEKAGSYNRETGAITLSLPILTPFSRDRNHMELRVLLAPKARDAKQFKKELDQIVFFQVLFNEILAHEIGEAVYANNPRVRAAWKALCKEIPPSSEIPNKERKKYFLTHYGQKSPNEDFADTFAVYMIFGSQFRSKTAFLPVIEKKYEFMKRVFSIDGGEREFGDMFGAGMYTISNRPDVDYEEMLRTELALQYEMDGLEDLATARFRAGLTAMSYEDAEELIAEAEERGEEITREEAVRRLSQNQRELAERIEDDERQQSVYLMIIRKTMQALMSPEFDTGKFDMQFERFARPMMDRNKKAAVAFLQKVNVPKSVANKVVKDLMPLYTGAGYILEKKLAGAKEMKESSDFDLEGYVKGFVGYIYGPRDGLDK